MSTRIHPTLSASPLVSGYTLVAIKIQHHFGHLNNNNKDGWNHNININHYSNNSNNYIYHFSVFSYVTNSLYSQPSYLKQNRTLSLLPPSKYH